RLVHEENGAGGSMDLALAAAPGVHTTTRTTGLGVHSSWTLTATAPGEELHANTFPSGLTATRQTTAAGIVTPTLPSGKPTTIPELPDPRFGMQAPVYSNVSVRAPSATTFTQTATRSATYTDPLDVFSMTSLTETTNLTSVGNYTSYYDGSIRKLY